MSEFITTHNRLAAMHGYAPLEASMPQQQHSDDESCDATLDTTGILEAQAELKAGLGQPYQWGVIEPCSGCGERGGHRATCVDLADADVPLPEPRR